MRRLAKNTCSLDLGLLIVIPFDPVVRKSARGVAPFVVGAQRSKASQSLHPVLAGLLLLSEAKSVRSELLRKSIQIRDDIKKYIDTKSLQVDQLSL